MTPLNPSKRVKTAKKVCREAERAPWVAILTVFINFQGDVLYFHEKENKFLIAWYIILSFMALGQKIKLLQGQNRPKSASRHAFLAVSTRFEKFRGVI